MLCASLWSSYTNSSLPRPLRMRYMHACMLLTFVKVCLCVSVTQNGPEDSVNSFERRYEMGMHAHIRPLFQRKQKKKKTMITNERTNKTNCCTFYHEFRSQFSIWVPKPFYKCTNTNPRGVKELNKRVGRWKVLLKSRPNRTFRFRFNVQVLSAHTFIIAFS